MTHFLAFTLLIGDQYRFAGIFFQQHGSVFQTYKITLANLASVDQRQCQPIGKTGAELFEQIKSQARPAGTIPMQKAHCRIQPYSFQCGTAVMRQQGIQEGQQSIGGIQWRPAATSVKAHHGLFYTDQMVENSKIRLRRLALQSAQYIQNMFLLQTN